MQIKMKMNRRMVQIKTATHHAPRQPARHQRKPHEQHRPRAPHRARVPIPDVLPAHAVLVDHVDHEHPQQRAQPRHPVHEGDVHGRGAVRLSGGRARVRGEHGGVEERPDGERELAGRRRW